MSHNRSKSMTLKEIRDKLLKGETLTDEEKKFLEAWDPDSRVSKTEAEKEADRKAAAARKEAEKAVQEATEKAAALEAKIKELEASTGTSEQQAEKKIELLTKQLDDLTTQIKSEKEAAATATRQSKMRLLASSLPWNADIADPKYQDLLMQERFKDISTEDLDNPTLTKPLLEGLKGEKAGLFTAKVPGGTGDHTTLGNTGAPTVVEGDALLKTALNGSIEEAEGVINMPLMRDASYPPYMRVSTDDHQRARR